MDETDEKFLESVLNGVKVLNGMEIADLTVKLSGIVLRKAEFDGNFSRVYSKVFERMVELEVVGDEDVTNILGKKGG